MDASLPPKKPPKPRRLSSRNYTPAPPQICVAPSSPKASPANTTQSPNTKINAALDINRTLSRRFKSHESAINLLAGTANVQVAKTKRDRIIDEILDTELTFRQDMDVIDKVYATPSLQIIPTKDHKLLFGGIPQIFQISGKFIQLLQNALSITPVLIGPVFRQMCQGFESVYCEYCKMNEQVMSKLQQYKTQDANLPEINKFLTVTHTIIATLDSEPDHPELELAFGALESLAETINNVKKRKDIVDKYVLGKTPTNVMHGISKKWGRTTHQIKKNIGINQLTRRTSLNGTGQDDESDKRRYMKLESKFMEFQSNILVLIKNAVAWIDCIQDQFKAEERFAVCLNDIYTFQPRKQTAEFDAVSSMVGEYQRSCQRLVKGPGQIAETQIKNVIIPQLEQIHSKFKEPLLLMRKRDQKLLDCERVAVMLQDSENVDKGLLESADAFESLNVQLLEELPIFLVLISEYVQIMMFKALEIQANLYNLMLKNILPLAEMFGIDDYMTTADIPKDFLFKMAVGGGIERLASSIPGLRNWWESVWVDGQYRVGRDPETEPESNSAEPTLIDAKGSKLAPRPLKATDESALYEAVLSNQILVPTRMYTIGPQVPEIYEVEPFVAKGLYTFSAECEDELGFLKGDLVNVVLTGGRPGCTQADAWWYGNKHGKLGWFPAVYVEIVMPPH